MWGLGRITEFGAVEGDVLLARLLRLPRLPDVTILCNKLERLATVPIRAVLQDVHEQVVAQTIGADVDPGHRRDGQKCVRATRRGLRLR